MLATFVGKLEKMHHFSVRRSRTSKPHARPSMGKENITCYDAVSRRAGPLFSTPMFGSNAIIPLHHSAPGGL